MKYIDFIQSDEANKLKELIEGNLEGPISFKDVNKLPQEKGVYFIYDKDKLVYIGESGTGKKQRIRERCSQYVNKGSGATFRDKLMKDKNLQIDKAISYIKQYCSVRYILENELIKMEHFTIGLFNPKYND